MLIRRAVYLRVLTVSSTEQRQTLCDIQYVTTKKREHLQTLRRRSSEKSCRRLLRWADLRLSACPVAPWPFRLMYIATAPEWPLHSAMRCVSLRRWCFSGCSDVMSATASTSAAELGTANDAGDVEPGALLSVLDDAQMTPCIATLPQAPPPVDRPADPSNCHVNYDKIADRNAASSVCRRPVTRMHNASGKKRGRTVFCTQLWQIKKAS